MAMFLYDREREYSYAMLLEEIQLHKEYYPYHKADTLFAFFANLVKAIATNQPLVLLDSDLSISEMSGIDPMLINKPVALPKYSFKHIDELITAMQKSASTITIFTSGTTGQPKQVVHSIDTLTRSVRTGDKYRNQVWGRLTGVLSGFRE